jgi:hypothetical protein
MRCAIGAINLQGLHQFAPNLSNNNFCLAASIASAIWSRDWREGNIFLKRCQEFLIFLAANNIYIRIKKKQMALFVLTSVLSLSAGLGIGALVPIHEQENVQQLKGGGHVKKMNPKIDPVPQRVHSVPQRVQSVPQRVQSVPQRVQSVSPKTPVLDFTDFDKSLMNLVQNQRSSVSLKGGGTCQKFSTLRKSVVANSNFYSPPTVLEGGGHQIKGGGHQIKGGGHQHKAKSKLPALPQPKQQQFETSWF